MATDSSPRRPAKLVCGAWGGAVWATVNRALGGNMGENGVMKMYRVMEKPLYDTVHGAVYNPVYWAVDKEFRRG